MGQRSNHSEDYNQIGDGGMIVPTGQNTIHMIGSFLKFVTYNEPYSYFIDKIKDFLFMYVFNLSIVVFLCNAVCKPPLCLKKRIDLDFTTNAVINVLTHKPNS